MATLTANRSLFGMELMSSNEFSGIQYLDYITRTSTRLTLEDEGDRINFLGTGFSYQMSGGQIVGMNGGTATGLTITNSSGAEVYLNWTGLNVSASSFFTYAVTGNWTALNTLLFNTGDTIKLTDARDVVRGFGGNDTIYGYNGNDRLLGDIGNDKLFGGNGADRLEGGTGNDMLIGGTGMDTMLGGAGADVFAFNENGATNHEIITDFRAVDDALHFNNDAFTAFAYTGQLRTSGFVAGTAATDTADRFIYHKATGNLWYDRDGSGAAAKVLVAELADGTALTAADIFII
ncbi:MAG: calcium-binding protein [Pseudorhodobacter sp.]|nr:MAG: calcium-binding protein [Pseudorhodobacter sp.]